MRIRSFLTFICLGLLLVGCDREPRLSVTGNILHGKGKTLYFELFGMGKVEVLDSTKLDEDGRFHFKTTLPGAPEFYRLRIGDRFIHLAADSTVKVNVKANATDFGQNYQVEGSRVCEQIRILSQKQGEAVIQINELTRSFNEKAIDEIQFREKLDEIFSKQRENAQKIIEKDPGSPAAYFALFQRIHNFLVFNPFDPQDNKYYAAVATAWDTFYPNSVRSKHLKLMTLQGMKTIKASKRATSIKIMEKDKRSFYEISLPDAFGRNKSLSSLKGKVVLLDFTALQADFSPDRNLAFRSLYQAYSKKGFEIFQISYDENEQFWKSSSSNLPWISVRDRNLQNSEYLTCYNIQQIPTYFLINRNGDIFKRDAMVKDLKNEIEGLL
jgi:peroxiredoxin